MGVRNAHNVGRSHQLGPPPDVTGAIAPTTSGPTTKRDRLPTLWAPPTARSPSVPAFQDAPECSALPSACLSAALDPVPRSHRGRVAHLATLDHRLELAH